VVEPPKSLVVEEHSGYSEHSGHSDYSGHSHSRVRHKQYRTANWQGFCDHIYYNKA